MMISLASWLVMLVRNCPLVSVTTMSDSGPLRSKPLYAPLATICRESPDMGTLPPSLSSNRMGLMLSFISTRLDGLMAMVTPSKETDCWAVAPVFSRVAVTTTVLFTRSDFRMVCAMPQASVAASALTTPPVEVKRSFSLGSGLLLSSLTSTRSSVESVPSARRLERIAVKIILRGRSSVESSETARV